MLKMQGSARKATSNETVCSDLSESVTGGYLPGTDTQGLMNPPSSKVLLTRDEADLEQRSFPPSGTTVISHPR